MKTLFMGTPAFAVPVLAALLEAGHAVVGVYTQPDRAAGRGGRSAASPVKQFAREQSLPVFQPATLRSREAQTELEALSPEVIVVAAYGLFLPKATLDLPPFGCLNVHPSLLPMYRGPSPVAATILSGDDTTGATIIRLDEGMDTGPVVARRETAIGADEDAEELTTRLFRLGADLLAEVLPDWAEGRIHAVPQDESQATTTRLLSRPDGEIDWTVAAERIARQVRAYHPWPGAFTHWNGELLKIGGASVADWEGQISERPGLVLSMPDGRLGIAAAEGVLEIAWFQLAGRRFVAADEFVWGHADFLGSLLGS